MHRYCLDTSGFSNPVMELPSAVFVSLWPQVVSLIESKAFLWNVEIAEELTSIVGTVGETLVSCNGTCCVEVGQGEWPWEEYISVVGEWRNSYSQYISEYNGNRKNTISLNDLSIVALAKVVRLPILSMEKRNTGQPSNTKLRIPDLCDREGVEHLTFNNVLVREGITV